jgi:hypothetical protein
MTPLTRADYFQQNVLCNILHNEKTIWFCKHEYIQQDFEKIKNIANDVIFVCGNSDYQIDELTIINRPKNVKYIFATNCFIANDIDIFSIPIGIESVETTMRNGHGVGFDFAADKIYQLNRIKSEKFETKNLIYSNFSIQTNHAVRQGINNYISTCNYITIENSVSMEHYFNQICSHEAVLCPIGNGCDTVRTYETLYCGKIPIIYGSDVVYKSLLYDLPCVYIDTLDEMHNYNHITTKIQEAKSKELNLEKAYLNYWVNKIKKYEQLLSI